MFRGGTGAIDGLWGVDPFDKWAAVAVSFTLTQVIGVILVLADRYGNGGRHG